MVPKTDHRRSGARGLVVTEAHARLLGGLWSTSGQRFQERVRPDPVSSTGTFGRKVWVVAIKGQALYPGCDHYQLSDFGQGASLSFSSSTDNSTLPHRVVVKIR